MDIPVEIIAGDRQTGKTTKALHMAFQAAASGDRVVYFSLNHREMLNALAIAQTMAHAEECADHVERVYVGHGNEHIRFFGGGKIVFTCHIRGFTCDTLVVDGPTNAREFAPAAAAAKLMIQTVLTRRPRPGVSDA